MSQITNVYTVVEQRKQIGDTNDEHGKTRARVLPDRQHTDGRAAARARKHVAILLARLPSIPSQIAIGIATNYVYYFGA